MADNGQYQYYVKAYDAARDANGSLAPNVASNEATPVTLTVNIPAPLSAKDVNGIFLNHGFMASPKTDAAIATVVQWLAQRKFTYQFLNLAALNADAP